MQARFYTHLFLLFLLSTCVVQVHAQQQAIDSILYAIRQHPEDDTIKVQLLSDLAYTYHTVSPDSTTLLAKQAYILAEKLSYPKGRADALKHWAIGAYLVAEYEQAIVKNEQALAIYKKLGDKKGCGAVLNNIAIIRHNQGDFQTALDYYNKSLAIRKEINDQRGIAACYNNIGNTYSDLGSYAEALYNIFRGLQLRERIGDRQGVANSLSNIANIYFFLGKYNEALKYSFRSLDMQKSIRNNDGTIQSYVAIGGVYHIRKQHDKALDYFTKALLLSKEMGNKHSIALCLSNIGEEYISQEKYTMAEKYFDQALELSNESGDQMSVAINHIGLGIVNLKAGRFRKSIGHLQSSYDIGSAIGSKLRILEASKHLSDAYEQINDLTHSNLYLKKYVAYKDSIFNDEVARKSQQLEFSFLLDKKQKEIALLEKDRSIQKEINDKSKLVTIFLSGLVSLSLIFILGLYHSRKRVKKANSIALRQKEEIERQAKELQDLNQLKDKVMSIMSHDLRSPLASLTSIVSLLDQDMITPEEFVMLKNGMNKQLSAVSLLLDNLLHWSRSQLQGEGVVHKTFIPVNEIIERNIALLQQASSNKNISLSYDNKPVTAYADPDQVDIVIRNLISNAIKFTGRSGKIDIAVTDQDHQIRIAVADNGIGMNEETRLNVFNHLHESGYGTDGEKGTGLGLVLCKDFIEQNNGTIGVTSTPGKGSTFYITLPAKPSEHNDSPTAPALV